MDLNRREFSTAAGVSLSAILAGCSALEDDAVDDEDGNETDGESEDTDDSDAEDARDSDDSDEDETESIDEQQLHEDESIAGTILLSDDAKAHLAVVRHTFTWMDEPPTDQCQVHVMLENTGGAELTVDMAVRIYDEDGTELSSTTDTGIGGPEPDEDDAVYSLELDDCEGTAEYEFEITNVRADEDDEPDESDDGADEPDDPDEDGDEQEDADDEDEVGDEDAEDGEDEADDDEPDDEDAEDDEEEPEETDDSDEQEDADDEDDEDEDDDEDDEDEDDDEDDEQEDAEDASDAEDEEDEDDDGDENDETNMVRVFVEDGDGDPITDATVEIAEGGVGGWSESQDVDGQGRADFEVEDGEYTLTAEADGYPTLEEDIEISGDVIYTLTLRTND